MDFSGQYLTYSEYREIGGTLAEMPFNILEFEARQNVDKYTLGRLKELTEQNKETKLCVFKLIKTLNSYNLEETRKQDVQSESTDGYSVTYKNTTEENAKAKDAETQSIVREYLIDCKLEDGTPYLFRGR